MKPSNFDTWTALLSDLPTSLIRKLEGHIDFTELPDFFQFANSFLTGQCPDREKSEAVIDVLIEGKVLHKALAVERVTTFDEAIKLMHGAMTLNPMFDASLLQYLLSGRLWPEEVPIPEIMRVLSLIESTSDAQRLSVTLIKFAKHPDTRVVSKAAKLLGKWVDSYDWVERFFQHSDARIRANLVQGLGLRKDLKPFLALIEKAIADPNDRVSTMAMAIMARYGHQRSKTFLHLRRKSKVEHIRDAAEFAFGVLTEPFVDGNSLTPMGKMPAAVVSGAGTTGAGTTGADARGAAAMPAEARAAGEGDTGEGGRQEPRAEGAGPDSEAKQTDEVAAS